MLRVHGITVPTPRGSSVGYWAALCLYPSYTFIWPYPEVQPLSLAMTHPRLLRSLTRTRTG